MCKKKSPCHFEEILNIFIPTSAKYPFISQQLLTIQEELNNKKSELEQAKEEQSHTQALLKVLQEQVSKGEHPHLQINKFKHPYSHYLVRHPCKHK
jgi:septal ring factor EnvC (AmiA/AmiB activator)